MYVMQVDMFGWFLIILIQNISSQQTLPDFWQSVLHMECYLLVLMQIDIFNTSLSCLLDLSLPIFANLHSLWNRNLSYMPFFLFSWIQNLSTILVYILAIFGYKNIIRQYLNKVQKVYICVSFCYTYNMTLYTNMVWH